jgi:hypothetical protein
MYILLISDLLLVPKRQKDICCISRSTVIEGWVPEPGVYWQTRVRGTPKSRSTRSVPFALGPLPARLVLVPRQQLMPNRYQVFFLLIFVFSLSALFVLSHLLQKALGQRGYSPLDLLLLGLPRNDTAHETASSGFIDPISVLIDMATNAGFDINTFVAENQAAVVGAVGAIVLTAIYFVFTGQKPKGELQTCHIVRPRV